MLRRSTHSMQLPGRDGDSMARATELQAKNEQDVVPGGSHWKDGLEWPAVLWIGSLHLGCLLAPFFFTWSGLALAVLMSWVTGSLGLCLGFHRLLTHSSF